MVAGLTPGSAPEASGQKAGHSFMAATHRDTTPIAATHHDTGSTNTRVVARVWEETKPSFKTTELIVLVATVAGVLVASTMDDSLNTLWAWILVASLSIGYMLSRGLAKSGSRHADDN
jgi:hypothetical protein